MNIKTVEKNQIAVAVVESDEVLIRDAQSALDLLMTAKYEARSSSIAISKDCITEEFFILSTRLAGEVLQKFINYQAKIAIYGDFSRYTSKPLKDFMYESNQGKDIFFVSTQEGAIEKLSTAR